MKQNSLKPFQIGYDDKIIIYPRLISVAEEDEINSKLNDIADSDPDKYQKEFEICIEALEKFSSQPAEKLVKVKSESKREVIEGGLKAYFTERTVENERIVREAFSLFRVQWRPESSFL